MSAGAATTQCTPLHLATAGWATLTMAPMRHLGQHVFYSAAWRWCSCATVTQFVAFREVPSLHIPACCCACAVTL